MTDDSRSGDREIERTMRLLAHDLRNPLAAILANAEILRSMVDGDEPREIATEIKEAGEVMRGVLADLTDSFRLEAGTLPLSIEPARLEPIASSVVLAHDAALSGRGIAASVDIPASEARLCDGKLLARVLAILVDAALRGCPSGGSVRMAATAEGLAVLDSGRAVRVADADLLDRFPGQHRDRPLRPLSLSLAAHAMRAMGGSLASRATDEGTQRWVLTLRAVP